MTKTITKYQDIPINHTLINQSLLDINIKVRSNLFSWNGQFSPQFVEALLTNFANTTDVVIDPFAGSGTTLCESARKGIRAYGMELNASAYHMAKTYELANYSFEERMAIVDTINSILDKILCPDDILPIITQSIQQDEDSPVSRVLSTLVVLLDLFNNELSIELMNKKWDSLKKIIVEIPFSKNEIKIDMGDARKLNLASDAATLLITSPPYINVFNYHQKYRRSVEALGYDVLAIARNEFGSNRKNRGNRLLTVIQYCIDMALSLKEAIRVCQPESRMVYVVGRESNVLGYSFCNSELIYNIGVEIFNLPFLLRQERVFKNRFGQMIYEDILHFENSKEKIFLDDLAIVEMARVIATRMLSEKAELMPESKNIEFIYDAIEKSAKINQSEG
ncbi:DNA methyltransferase [Solobacterium moorei]